MAYGLRLIALAALVLVVARAVVGFPEYSFVLRDRSSGVYAALASDAAKGLWYRPLLSVAGYGGTRYFPLYIVLHSSLIRLGLSPLAAGYALCVLTFGLLIHGLYRLCRRLDLSVWWALTIVGLALSSRALQMNTTRIAADELASALNVWGLSLVLDDAIAGAAVVLALALLTKVSLVFGPLAAAAWLWHSGQRRRAAYLLLLVLLLFGIGMWASNWMAGGRFFSCLRACVLNGATDADLKMAPLSFAQTLWSRSPSTIALLLLALAATWSTRHRLPLLLLVMTLLVLPIVYCTPHVDYTHLADLDLAAWLVVGVALATPDRRFALLGWGAGLTALAGTIYCARGNWPVAARGLLLNVVAHSRAGDGPLLSDNPWIPILGHEAPYLLNSDALHQLASSHPELAADVNAALERRFFRAVALERPARAHTDFEMIQPAFTALLSKHYEIAFAADNYFVWRPRRDGP